MRIIFASLMISVFCINRCIGAPIKMPRGVLLLSTRGSSLYNIIPYQPPLGSRGPFDFLGNWIQSSDWFPIEINVPDTIASIGNGVGSFATNVGNGINNFAQNVGTGFQTFTQNLGTGFQTFTQNLTQRFPMLAVLVRPNSPPRYFVLLPTENVNEQKKYDDNSNNNIRLDEISGDILESFP